MSCLVYDRCGVRCVMSVVCYSLFPGEGRGNPGGSPRGVSGESRDFPGTAPGLPPGLRRSPPVFLCMCFCMYVWVYVRMYVCGVWCMMFVVSRESPGSLPGLRRMSRDSCLFVCSYVYMYVPMYVCMYVMCDLCV